MPTPTTPVATPCRARGVASSAGNPFQCLKSADEAAHVVVDLDIESDDNKTGSEAGDFPDEGDKGLNSFAFLDGIDDDSHDDERVPDILDQSIKRPKAGEVRLSQAAISARLRRIMKPDRYGSFKVSQAVINDFNSVKGKKSIQQIFQMCGYCPDRGPKLFWTYACIQTTHNVLSLY